MASERPDERITAALGSGLRVVNGHYNGHMLKQVTATEAKKSILGLLDEVAAGAEIEITKHGRTVARLVPARGPAAFVGMFAGSVSSTDDDEDLFSTGEGWSAS